MKQKKHNFVTILPYLYFIIPAGRDEKIGDWITKKRSLIGMFILRKEEFNANGKKRM